MHVEADFLCRCRPVFVTEAVDICAIVVSIKAMVTRGGGSFVEDVVTLGMLYLEEGG